MKPLSLFFKLTLVSVVAMLAGLALMATVGHMFKEEFHQKVGRHARYLAPIIAQELRQGVDEESLHAIAEKYEVDIRYQDSKTAWTNDEDMRSLATIKTYKPHKRRWTRRLPPPMQVLEDNDHDIYLYAQFRDKQIAIELEDWHGQGSWWWVLGLVALSLIAVISYVLIRRQLQPIETLRLEVEKIGHGHWFPLEVKRDDEIGKLAQSFNQMQDRLKEEIDMRERFLRDASHEIRSPLARLRLCAEIGELSEVGEESEWRQQLIANVVQIERLTEGILKNVRLRAAGGELPREKIKLLPLLHEIIVARLPAEQARITLTAPTVSNRQAPEELAVNGVRESLLLAVDNVIDNGLKYADKVTITLLERAGATHREKVIQISDNGEGVSEKDLPHLFQPFYRTDVSRTRATGGFGLGLAISAAAVESQGGTIEVSNMASGGLMVEIVFTT